MKPKNDWWVAVLAWSLVLAGAFIIWYILYGSV